MKNKGIALLLALLMLPFAALTLAEDAEAPGTADETALRLMEAVFASEDEAERISLVLQAAQAAPDNVEIQVSAAQLLYYMDETGEYAEKAEALLAHALDIAEGDERIYAVQAYAEQLVYWDRVAEAMPLVEEAIATFPANEQLKITYATVLFYADEADAALGVMTDLLEDSPRNLEARRLHAAILLDMFRFDEALQAFQQIESEWPEYLDGLYGQYMTYKAAGRFDMAVRAIDMLLGAGVEDELWLERARVRLWNQMDPEQAVKEAEALLRMDPAWADAAIVKMGAHLMLEEYDQAHEAAALVGQADADLGTLMDALVYMNEGEWAEGEQMLVELAQRLPDAYLVWKNIAMARLEGMDDIQGATDALARAFAATGGMGDAELYSQQGQLYARQNNLLEAARAFMAADMVATEDTAPLYYLVITCLDAGRAADAQEVLAEMERRYPGWHDTMLARVFVETSTNNFEAALAAHDAFAAKYPFPASHQEVLACMLAAETGDAQAVQRLGEIAEADATPENLDAYAYVLLLVDDLDGAKAALARAEEALEAQRDTMTEGALRSTQVSLLCTRAELERRQDNLDGFFGALEQAAALGWSVHSIALEADIDTLRQHPGYDALMALAPALEDDWDLSIPPTIPK